MQHLPPSIVILAPISSFSLFLLHASSLLFSVPLFLSIIISSQFTWELQRLLLTNVPTFASPPFINSMHLSFIGFSVQSNSSSKVILSSWQFRYCVFPFTLICLKSEQKLYTEFKPTAFLHARVIDSIELPPPAKIPIFSKRLFQPIEKPRTTKTRMITPMTIRIKAVVDNSCAFLLFFCIFKR